MAIVELLMPKMGESIIEATIIGWTKQVGDQIEVDETVLEVATDKVDSEVPSPVSGVLTQILHQKDEVVAVGAPLALIETDAAAAITSAPAAPAKAPEPVATPEPVAQEAPAKPAPTPTPATSSTDNGASTQKSSANRLTPQSITNAIPSSANGHFFSPLVRNIAKAEGISVEELSSVAGSGPDGRVTKIDLINYIDQKKQGRSFYTPPAAAQQVTTPAPTPTPATVAAPAPKAKPAAPTAAPVGSPGDEVIELTRMRKVIAGHMRNSLDTSAHVTTFIEADATRLVTWRNKIKNDYLKKYGEKITFSPLFTECVIKALREHPQINATLDGDHLIVKKDLNIGIATAMKNGNLIVPVIRRANDLNLHGLTRQLNDLTSRARENNLKADEIGGGTFTISNLGTFGNVMGTPIINQPELAIVALGAIKKKAVIQETPEGDIIAIRHMMFLSLSFDHRVIDGYQGGVFLNSIAKHIENFDTNRTI